MYKVIKHLNYIPYWLGEFFDNVKGHDKNMKLV